MQNNVFLNAYSRERLIENDRIPQLVVSAPKVEDNQLVIVNEWEETSP